MKEPPRNKSRANADLFPVTFVKSYPAIDTKWRQGAARGNARSIIALARSPYKGPFIPPSGEGGGGGGGGRGETDGRRVRGKGRERAETNFQLPRTKGRVIPRV